jgi:hydroxypyruvate isomerase
MAAMSRRNIVKSVMASTALAFAPEIVCARPPAAPSLSSGSGMPANPIIRKGRINQSACRWCYRRYSVDELSAYGARIGLKGIDLLTPEEYEIPRRYGLVCSMGYADAGTIRDGLNRLANHNAIEAGLRKNVPLAAKMGVPNVITFSGVRAGLSDDEGLKNSVIGLNRVKKIAEDNGVNICMELLNSKVDHPDYMADNSAWGVKLMEAVNSPNVKLLYDIYHMHIQEGDLTMTIQKNIQWMEHFHTGGVPGRHELDDRQEVQWDGVMRGIAASSFTGFVAHEFLPIATDPLTSLLQAVDICDV